jgi:hypothetical protein
MGQVVVKNVLVVDIYVVIAGVREVMIIGMEPLPIPSGAKIAADRSVMVRAAKVRLQVIASAVFLGWRVASDHKNTIKTMTFSGVGLAGPDRVSQMQRFAIRRFPKMTTLTFLLT